MKKVFALFILCFLLYTIINYRFGFPNTEEPMATDIKGESIPSSSLETIPTSFTEYSLYDENRTCFLWGDETFLTFKKSVSVIERDDECEHCKKAWKWHYNK